MIIHNIIDLYAPTLLPDKADTILTNGGNAEMGGILNAGLYERSWKAGNPAILAENGPLLVVSSSTPIIQQWIVFLSFITTNSG